MLLIKMLCLALMTVLIPTPVLCQLEWRVSVKFIVDADGDRPFSGILRTDADVQNQFNFANNVLERLGRGYRLHLMEITNLSNHPYVTNFFNADSTDKYAATVLERVAETNKLLFRYRDDAINIYINGFQGEAVSSYPSDPPDANDIILAGQRSVTPTLVHEIGHYFSLYHTMGRECQGCTGPNACSVPGDDEIADTLPVVTCWTQDQIATNAFGLHYADLMLDQQAQVDMTYSNVMSYRITGRTALTPDQLDRVTDISNGVRNKVATGGTWFVAATGNDSNSGSSIARLRTVAKGILLASAGDIILLRAGNYNEPMMITKPVTLRATRGNATVGRP